MRVVGVVFFLFASFLFMPLGQAQDPTVDVHSVRDVEDEALKIYILARLTAETVRDDIRVPDDVRDRYTDTIKTWPGVVAAGAAAAFFTKKSIDYYGGSEVYRGPLDIARMWREKIRCRCDERLLKPFRTSIAASRKDGMFYQLLIGPGGPGDKVYRLVTGTMKAINAVGNFLVSKRLLLPLTSVATTAWFSALAYDHFQGPAKALTHPWVRKRLGYDNAINMITEPIAEEIAHFVPITDFDFFQERLAAAFMRETIDEGKIADPDATVEIDLVAVMRDAGVLGERFSVLTPEREQELRSVIELAFNRKAELNEKERLENAKDLIRRSQVLLETMLASREFSPEFEYEARSSLANSHATLARLH